jgi:uncharacterized protein YndB with AHSA1/START domain
VDPVVVTATIARPREEVFDYLADIANLPEFAGDYVKDLRLTRIDSVGQGAGARYRLEAPLNRFSWADMTYVLVDRPYRIVAVGRGGKFNRIEMTTIWTLEPTDGDATRLEVMTETVPPLPTDKVVEAVTGFRRWTRRRLGRSVRRLQEILEEDAARGPRATVAGL